MKSRYHVVTWPETIVASLLLGVLMGVSQAAYLEMRVMSKLDSIESNLDNIELTLDDICTETAGIQYKDNTFNKKG